MPWKVYSEKNGDDTKYCVHELNEDDSKGKKLKCYDEKKAAEDYAAALYANADEMKKSVSVDDSGDHDSNVNNAAKNDSADSIHKGDPPLSNTSKMESYSQIIRHVSDAWHEHTDWSMGYVTDVAPDYIIVCHKKVHWKVPYSMNDGAVTFGDNNEWEKVEEKREWVAAEKYAIKALNDSRIGGYAVLWGDKDRKDLHGEWFDRETEELQTIFKAMGKIPFLFHHGIDETVKSTVIGAVDVMEEDDVGLWYEAKIQEFEAYRQYVEPLINRKALFTSSGTLPGAKRVTKNGQIKRWPIAEITGTHIPAEYRMLQVPIDEIKNAYKSVGVDVADFERQFANADATQNEFETKGVEETRFRIENEIRLSKLQLLDLENI